ncbi:unnamed protein product [Arctogadus glacialis]
MSRQILKHLVSPEGLIYTTEYFRQHCIPACISAHSDHTLMSRMQHSSDGDVEFISNEGADKGVHLLTQSKTSTSSPRARPPPPVTSPPEQLKGEAERLGAGGLWCQDGPETEAGDQGPAAPDQRVIYCGDQLCL